MLLCTRQFGKSSVTAAKGAHHGATRREALILVTSPGERQSTELLLKIKRTLRETGVAEIKRETATTLELTNGSRYFALPGQEHTIRGFSAVTLLIVDEAARVPVSLYEAVGPMMAVSKGQTMLLSSAWFKTGFFWEQWSQEGDRWRKFRVTALECPRIDRAWLERERLTTYAGRPKAFDREFMCEFQELEGVALSLEHFDKAVGTASMPRLGELREQPAGPDFRAWFGGMGS